MFAPPSLHLIHKTGRIKTLAENEKKRAYRCLATFDKLEDRVILGRLAAYLRDAVDPLLLPCAYAFRKDGARYSYLAAVKSLQKYRTKYQHQKLYVAECDIQKFFDCINHDAILDAFDAFAQRLKAGKTPIDARVRPLLISYLNAYAFPQNLDNSCDPIIQGNRRFVQALPAKDLERLYPGTLLSSLRLGIPQGGALSPVLANLVMDAADRAVLADDEQLFYARFCDDMIIVHPDKRKCAEALDRYLAAIQLLRLPAHHLRKRVTYGKEYFEAKSKGPVAWESVKREQQGTPWVSFLGFHVHTDGTVRIRKESLYKHIEKMNREITIISRFINHPNLCLRKSCDWPKLLRDFELRLIAAGVGRAQAQTNDESDGQNWLSAFLPLLSHSPDVVRQLKRLDQERTHLLRKIRGLIRTKAVPQPTNDYEAVPLLPASASQPPPMTSAGNATAASGEKTNKADESGISPKKKRYFGAPYSYYGSFMNLDKPSLSDSAPPQPPPGIGYADL